MREVFFDLTWSLEITRGQNGYKLKYADEIEEDGISNREEYIQDDDTDELKSGEELLWWVIEYFGFGGSKHDKERLRIIREGGE